MLQMGRHYIVVKTAEGRTRRWSPDELNSRRQYQNLRFTTGQPGHFLTCTVRLPTDIDLVNDDTEGFSEIWVKLPGAEIVWEGFITAAPRSEEDDGAWAEVSAIGWNGSMKDLANFQMIFVSRDLTAFTGPSAGRRSLLAAFNRRTHRMVNDPNVAAGSVSLEVEGAWPAGITPAAEAWFDAGPKVKIARIYYSVAPSQDLITPWTGWSWTVQAHTDEAGIGTNYSTANLVGASATGAFVPTAPLRYAALVKTGPGGAAGADGRRYVTTWTDIALYGDHGLTLYGAEPRQVRIADAVRYTVQRSATQLQALATDISDPAGTTAGHLVCGIQEGGIDAAEAVEYLNRLVLNAWGVKENRRFFWQPRGSYGTTWVTRRDEGTAVGEDGQEIESIYDRVMVTYTDAGGRARSVGPPGSGADTETSLLQSTLATNLAVKHGRPRMAKIDSGAQILASVAITIGQIFLTEANRASTSGEIEVTGNVRRIDGGDSLFPPSQIREGDYVIVADDDNTDPRLIFSTDFDDQAYTNMLTVDGPPKMIEVLLEQLQVDLIGRV